MHFIRKEIDELNERIARNQRILKDMEWALLQDETNALKPLEFDASAISIKTANTEMERQIAVLEQRLEQYPAGAMPRAGTESHA